MKPLNFVRFSILASGVTAVVLPLAFVAAHQIISRSLSVDTMPTSAVASNIGANHFAIDWFTNGSVTGKIHWGTSPNALSNVTSDGRGDVTSTVHQVGVDVVAATASANTSSTAKSFTVGKCATSQTLCAEIDAYPGAATVPVNTPMTIQWAGYRATHVFLTYPGTNDQETILTGTLNYTSPNPGSVTFSMRATDDSGATDTDSVTVNFVANTTPITYSVGGIVTNTANGTPVAGVQLFASGQPPVQAVSGANGSYGMGVASQLGPNNVCIQTLPPGYALTPQLQATGGCIGFTVASNNQSFQINFQVQSNAAPSSISGNVHFTNGQPVAVATIDISQANQSTTTDQNGNYSFQNVNPGNYAVCLTNGPPAQVVGSNCAQVTVPPNAQGVNFTLQAIATATPFPSITPIPTPTPIPTQTPVPSGSNTPLPTYCPTGSCTPVPSATDTPTPGVSATPTPTGSVAPTPTGSVAPTPSGQTPAPTATPGPSASPVASGFQRIYFTIESGGDMFGGTDLQNLVQNGQPLFVDIPLTVSGATAQCGNTAIVADCPDTAFGRVNDQNGNPVTNAIVSITVTHNGQTSAPITAVTSTIGTYTADIGNAILPSFTQYLTYNRTSGDTLEVSAVTPNGQSQSIATDTGHDKPVPTLVVNETATSGSPTATPSSTAEPSVSPVAPSPSGGQTLTITAAFEGQAPATQNGEALLTDSSGQKQWVNFVNSNQVVIDASGYTVGKTYTFTLKGFAHLTVTRIATIQSGNTNIDFAILTGGDVAPLIVQPITPDSDKEDDLIEVLDYSVIKEALGQPTDAGLQAQFSDLNANGIVDVVDLSILKNNFGLKGDALNAASPSPKAQ